MARPPFRIAAIPGDGIGREVLPEAHRVLDAAARRHGIALQFTPFDWASGDWYVRHGTLLPSDWRRQLQGMDAICFGAIGSPGLLTDAAAERGTLGEFGRAFDQCLNLRPVRLFEGVPCPLAGRRAGDFEFVVVREMASRDSGLAPDRVLQFAFGLAQSRARHRLTVATPSAGASGNRPGWDERTAAMARRYPEIVVDTCSIDALCAQFVLQPTSFDMVVAPAEFGSILSDLGPACAGTIGLAPSACINPERRWPSLFKPMQGAAPDIAGRGIANPIAMIWAGALMLDFLGQGTGPCRQAHDAILRAIEAVLVEGPHTPDLGGGAATQDVGRAIAERVLA